jgi:cholesterol transport system auxiliary component
MPHMKPLITRLRLYRLPGRVLCGLRWPTLATGLSCLLALGLSACALPSAQERPMATYDLGVPPLTTPLTAPATGARPTIVMTDVQAPSWLDSQHIYYRLAFADPLQPKPYAQATWVMSPAQLLTQRARLRLAQVANVLSAGDSAQEFLLKLELDDFSQVFDTQDSSRGVVQLRASLISSGRFVAQHSFALAQPAPSANAAGGVRALGAATDAVLNELAAWVDSNARPRAGR